MEWKTKYSQYFDNIEEFEKNNRLMVREINKIIRENIPYPKIIYNHNLKQDIEIVWNSEIVKIENLKIKSRGGECAKTIIAYFEGLMEDEYKEEMISIIRRYKN
jgi:hypothetical protein